MKKPQQKLPEAELDIMLVLWEADKPLKAAEILDRLSAKRDWTLSTVYSMLDRLCERGYTVMTYEKRFRFYAAAAAKEEYMRMEKKSFLDNFFDSSPSRLVASLISSRDLTDKDIEELESLLMSAKNEQK